MRAGTVFAAVVAMVAISSGAPETSATPAVPQADGAAPIEEPKLEDFGWMVGHWRGEGFGGVCEEFWTDPLGGSMLGLFRHIQEGQLAFSEHMTLTRGPDGIVLKVKHFTPEFVGWEDKEGAVQFRLQELRANEAVFGGLRIRRTGSELELLIRMKDASGETRDERILLHRQP